MADDFQNTDGMGFVKPADHDRRCVRCGRTGHRSNGRTWPVTLPTPDTTMTVVGLPAEAAARKEMAP